MADGCIKPDHPTRSRVAVPQQLLSVLPQVQKKLAEDVWQKTWWCEDSQKQCVYIYVYIIYIHTCVCVLYRNCVNMLYIHVYEWLCIWYVKNMSICMIHVWKPVQKLTSSLGSWFEPNVICASSVDDAIDRKQNLWVKGKLWKKKMNKLWKKLMSCLMRWVEHTETNRKNQHCLSKPWKHDAQNERISSIKIQHENQHAYTDYRSLISVQPHITRVVLFCCFAIPFCWFQERVEEKQCLSKRQNDKDAKK